MSELPGVITVRERAVKRLLAVVVVASAAGAVAATEAVARAQTRLPGGDMPMERPSLGRIKVPYPNSVVPTEVIANIRKIIASVRLDEVSAIPELNGELHAGRILEVRSDQPPPGFIVVELRDSSGSPIANFAMTRGGEFMGLENAKWEGRGRSLSLEEATDRARTHLSTVSGAEYVYFTNVAEPGISIFRPLIAIATPEGRVYMNSRGEVFAERASRMAQQIDPGRSLSQFEPDQATLRVKLQSVGRW